jgi:hypothetical protein
MTSQVTLVSKAQRKEGILITKYNKLAYLSK